MRKFIFGFNQKRCKELGFNSEDLLFIHAVVNIVENNNPKTIQPDERNIYNEDETYFHIPIEDLKKEYPILNLTQEKLLIFLAKTSGQFSEKETMDFYPLNYTYCNNIRDKKDFPLIGITINDYALNPLLEDYEE